MDFGDLFGFNGTEGTRATRIVTGIIGAVAGGGIGAVFGVLDGETALAPFSSGAIGAVIDGFLGALFSGFILLGLFICIAVGLSILWQTYVKG